MVDETAGSGDALDAAVATEDNTSEAPAEAAGPDTEALDAEVAAAQAKVAKQRDHLAGAEAALKAAQDNRAAAG
jgi:hypothetical protein